MTDVTICLDARTVHPHFPGIRRYAANLTNALVAQLGADECLVVLHDRTQPPTWLRTQAAATRVRAVAASASPFSVRQQWEIPALLRRLNVDLYHSPYYLIPFWPGVPAVVTLHDLIPILYPRLFTPGQRVAYRIATRLAVRAARVIITVSAAAARDIERLLPVAAERLVVVPAAADPTFRAQPPAAVEAMRRRFKLASPYVLYVGSNKPHKNLVQLVEAWGQLHPSGTDLVIAGAWDVRFPHAQRRAEQLGISDRVRFVGPVTDSDLTALYSGALLFVFPSESEGFGLPVIEAMACGVPVACSTAASLVEVAGKAALHFPPRDVDAMAAAIGAALADEDLRRDLSRRGLERAGQFSWEAAARSTLAIYRRALR